MQLNSLVERKMRKPPPVRKVSVEELEPKTFIGPRTAVRRVFRVRETLDGKPFFHLVFFDQYGWYCEHGSECKAVADCKELA